MGEAREAFSPHPIRILVVGINYAPEHTGIAPYTTGLAEFMLSQGADVQVLTGVPHYPAWTVPPAYRWARYRDEVVRGVPVRRLRHFVPRAQTAIRRGAYEATFGAQVLAQHPQPADVVYAVVPSLLGARAAAALARRWKVPLVVHVQDLMGRAAAQSGIAGGSSSAVVAERFESAVLLAAARVIVINETFRDTILNRGVLPDQVRVVRNWTHVRSHGGNRSLTRRRLGWDSDTTVVLHSGNMGLKQGLDSVVEAARLTSHGADDVLFVLMGDGSQRPSLERRGVGVASLAILPPTSDADYPDVLEAADVLLVNERASAVDMSLPSKLTSYCQAGRPIIAAVPLEGGTALEVRRSGAGVVVPPEDPEVLVRAVQQLRDDEASGRRMAANGRAYARTALAAQASLRAIWEVVVDVASVPGSRHLR